MFANRTTAMFLNSADKPTNKTRMSPIPHAMNRQTVSECVCVRTERYAATSNGANANLYTNLQNVLHEG